MRTGRHRFDRTDVIAIAAICGAGSANAGTASPILYADVGKSPSYAFR
jgi:hypothetical protein